MKIKIRTTHRLEVFADNHFIGNYSDQENHDLQMNKLREIQRGIHQHIDDVAFAVVRFEIEERCSHCGLIWEEDEDMIPQCCTKAQEEIKEIRQQNNGF